MEPIRRVAFVGVGAVGGIYAQCFANEASPLPYYAVVRDPQAYSRDPVTIGGVRLEIPYCQSGSAPAPADLILLSVKTYHLPQAMADIARLIGPHTLVLSLLNGIQSEETLAAAFGWEHVLFATCSGVDANRAGHAITLNRRGEILFGEAGNARLTPRVNRVRALFETVGIPYRIPLDMRRALWWKFMVNVGMNQVSAVLGYGYGDMRRSPDAMALMRSAQEEVLSLAQAVGVDLTARDMRAWEEQLQSLSPEGRPSTLQDLWQRRKTEVESLGGEVLRRGKALGIPTPVNRMLYAKIREIEQAYGAM